MLHYKEVMYKSPKHKINEVNLVLIFNAKKTN